MSKEKQLITCTICIEEMKETQLAKIECCTHKFCYECIKNWATKQSNTCPNCVKKFNQITYKENGLEKTFEVEDKGQSSDEESYGSESDLEDEDLDDLSLEDL